MLGFLSLTIIIIVIIGKYFTSISMICILRISDFITRRLRPAKPRSKIRLMLNKFVCAVFVIILVRIRARYFVAFLTVRVRLFFRLL